jgi:hypothetical protein
MEVELGKVAGGTSGVEMDGDGAGAGGARRLLRALRGEAEATRSGVGAGDTGAGVKRSPAAARESVRRRAAATAARQRVAQRACGNGRCGDGGAAAPHRRRALGGDGPGLGLFESADAMLCSRPLGGEAIQRFG